MVPELDAALRRAGLHRDASDVRAVAELPLTGDLDALELRIGHPLPHDVRHFLRFHSGTRTGTVVDCPDGADPRIGVAPVSFVGAVAFDRLPSQQDAIAESVFDFAEDAEELAQELRTVLVPFSKMMPYAFFCLDFRNDPVEPPVVFVDSADCIIAPDGGRVSLHWVRYVAPSFMEFLRQCHPNKQRLAPSELDLAIDDYPFAENLLMWERDFDAHVSKWFPTIRRTDLG